jgi:FSR family fosmidomycin resistance protein-like MFS transporter
MSDRWGTQWFLPAGILWTGMLMGMVGLVPSYWTLLLVLVLTGVGTAAYHPVAAMAAAHAARSQRGLGVSFFSVGGNLGFALGPILMTWILFLGFGLKGTTLLILPGLAAAGFVHVYRREIEGPFVGAKERRRQERAPIPWPKLSRLCALITLRSWGYSGLIIFLPLFLREQGIDLSVAGRALFVFLFFGALGGMLGGHLSDRVGRQQVIATSLLTFPFLSGPPRWILLAVAGMALLASFSVTVVFAQELLPQHLGLASGLTLGLAFGAGGLGVGMSGLMADLLGLRTSVWTLVFLPGLAGLLALKLRSPRTRLHEAPAPLPAQAEH